jgi:hypothetical protein
MDIMQGVDRRLRLGVKNVLVSIPQHSSRKTFGVLQLPMDIESHAEAQRSLGRSLSHF